MIVMHDVASNEAFTAIPSMLDVNNELAKLMLVTGETVIRLDRHKNVRDTAVIASPDEIPELPTSVRKNIRNAAEMALTISSGKEMFARIEELDAAAPATQNGDDSLELIEPIVSQIFKLNPELVNKNEKDVMIRSAIARRLFAGMERNDYSTYLSPMQARAGTVVVQKLVKKSLLAVPRSETVLDVPDHEDHALAA